MMKNYIDKLNALDKKIESAEHTEADGVQVKIIYSKLLRDVRETNNEIRALLRELEELF